MTLVIWLGILGSTIWVGIDASKIGMQRGRLGGGTLDMGVASWVLATLLIWIVGFPCYLVARSKYQQMYPGIGAQQAYPTAQRYPGAHAYPVAPGAAYAPMPVAPPQLSPDGHWWWDGYQWVPAAAAQRGYS